ncbi:NAD(P)H-binding protein [Nocardia sp. NBC_01730]|uniref:NAD(P)-dependent oxidoreductase n=1 Tax=Nocardia sp. NBC_01730 TaxID=2975998 RepID=UPI002E0EC560|nr:NAD(P)H-binding protein [Nocardia sp. NBC_01730]
MTGASRFLISLLAHSQLLSGCSRLCRTHQTPARPGCDTRDRCRTSRGRPVTGARSPANGPTGRLLTGQALAAGHQVAALTRQPDSFPLHHDRLEVIGTDVLDPVAVDAAVAGRDAVLSTLGVPAGKEPISAYSRGAANFVTAMQRHGCVGSPWSARARSTRTRTPTAGFCSTEYYCHT